MEEGKLRIEKFDGKDFGFWKMQIEDYLYQKNLYFPLTSKSSGMKEEEWKVLDRQALGVIRLTLAKSVAYNVKDVTTTVGVIKAFSNMYEKSSAMNKLKCDDVRDLILSESLRRKNSGESSGGAYFSEGRGRGRQQRGAQRGRSKSRGRSNSKGKVNIVCWGCGVKGHTKRECPNPKKKGGSNHKNHDDASSSVSLASSDEIGDALILSVDSPIGSWILDSGASFHSSPCKDIFQNFKSGKFGKVYLADDEPLEILGKGDVMIKTSSGSSWKLEDVRYIPKLRKNLISVGQLDSSGYRTMFGEGIWKVSKGAMVVARGTKTDNFGGKSVEKESIEDEREFVELDGKVRSDKEVKQVEVEVQIQQASPQHGAHVPVDSDSSDSDDDDHLETDERVVMGEPVVVHGEPSTPPTGFLEEMGMKQDVCALYSDSQSAVQLAKNPMFHYRTKHIKRRYHYTRSLVKDGTMCLRKIAGSKNPADMLTKAVSSDKLRLCRTSIGLHH
uniref:CCHC-type domain-containing protein n=1 Tax=Chenopodium quinoa TaxID=63459 RepID=A0A803M738_CHEQI